MVDGPGCERKGVALQPRAIVGEKGGLSLAPEYIPQKTVAAEKSGPLVKSGNGMPAKRVRPGNSGLLSKPRRFPARGFFLIERQEKAPHREAGRQFSHSHPFGGKPNDYPL